MADPGFTPIGKVRSGEAFTPSHNGFTPIGHVKAQATQPAPTPAPTKKSGGGLLGTIGHVISQGASDLEHAAINSPAGLAQFGKAFGQDVAEQTMHPLRPNQGHRTLALLGGMAKQTQTDLSHPLRHPGNTLLDTLPLLGGAARVGVAGRTLAEGEGAAAAARQLVKPNYGERTLRVGGAEVHPETSRAAFGAAAQHATDKLLQKTADASPTSRTGRLVQRAAAATLEKKVGRIVTSEARTQQAIMQGPGAGLVALANRLKLKPAEQKALQVVAEEAPLDQRITAASARVTGAKDTAARARHQAELDLLHQAKPLLGEDGAGRPVFAGGSAKRLNVVLGKMRQVAGGREELLKGLGLLTDQAVQGRKAHAARVAIGQPLEHPVETPPAGHTPGQLSLIPEPAKPPLFAPSEQAVRVPDVATKAPRSLGRGGAVGAAGSIGHQKLPGSVSHEYTGALRENALRRQDTAQLVGETGMEAAKYAAVQHVHDFARDIARTRPEPGSPTDVAVRLDNLKSSERLPLEVKKFVQDPEEFFKTASPAEAASMLDKVKSHLFIDPKNLDPQAAAEFQRLAQEGKIGWVPKRVLGEFAKPQAPLSAVAGARAVRAVDTINNAQRFAILYLKPAYAIPNLLGNAALNLLQQGFAAPGNLARAARLNGKLGAEMTARIDTLMGEGVARAISAHGAGRFSGVIDKAAGGWSKVVDTPFRRSSFLYEARRAGYRTQADLERLLTDPAKQRDLIRVTQTANREIIDYANLTPAEREVVRRVVFFYPWVKGSTVYAGRMLREHPVKAAAIGALGQQGQQWSQNQLGQLPSYLEGLIPAGAGTVVNPNSAAILQTPAQVAQTVQGIVTGNMPEAAQASNFYTPAISLAAALATRKNPATGFSYKGGTSAAKVAEDVLLGGLPQVTLYRNIKGAGKHPEKLYPPSLRSAILQFLVGGVAPRRINLAKAHQLAKQEQTMMRTGYGR